jgi:hypothetical protein
MATQHAPLHTPPGRISPPRHSLHEAAGIHRHVEEVGLLRVEGPVGALQHQLVQVAFKRVAPSIATYKRVEWNEYQQVSTAP